MDSTTYNGNGMDPVARELAMETIMKCLRLAADPGATDGERNVANLKAEKIMAKWQISTMEMRMKTDAKKPRTTDQVKDSTEEFFDAGADWEWKLASGVARTFNSRIIVLHNSGVQFFGHPQDLEIIDYFFSKLRMEIDSWAEDAYPRHKKDRRSYAMGMTIRVTDRLKALYEAVQAQMTNDCKELVLISNALITQRMKELYPSTKPMRMKAVSDSAYARGYQDGSQLNLESNRMRLQ